MTAIDFWYEFASTYSYPAAMRIEAHAAAAAVAVRWRPFLLGPIFSAQGLSNSPFQLFPVKGRYMWRDMERICGALDLPWRQPVSFPQRSVLAARVALALGDADRPAYSKAVYNAQFGEGRDIADPATHSGLLTRLGHDSDAVLAAADSRRIKDALRTETETAQGLGIFGAPSLVTTDGELFWGNDRLDAALAWATRARTS